MPGLDETHLKVLHEVSVLRHLSNEQAHQLAPELGCLRTIQRYTQRLVENRFLGSFGGHRVGAKMTPLVFHLTQKGHKLLQESGLISEESKFKKSGKLTWTPLTWHRLGIVDCLVSIKKAVAENPEMEIIFLESDFSRGSDGKAATRVEFKAEGRQRIIIPDAEVVIRTPEVNIMFLIEYDRQNESLKSGTDQHKKGTVIQKLFLQQDYLHSEKFVERHKLPRNRIFPLNLWVASEDWRRCANMANLAHKTRGLNPHFKGLSYFSTLPRIKELGFFGDAWLKGTVPEKLCSIRS